MRSGVAGLGPHSSFRTQLSPRIHTRFHESLFSPVRPNSCPEIEEASAPELPSVLAIRLLFAYTFASSLRAKYFLWGRVFQSPRVAFTGDVRVMFVSVCRTRFERESWPPPITPSAHFLQT